MPPKPPHLHPPHEPPVPPHLRKKNIDFPLLGKSVALASVFCALLGTVLYYSGIGLNVILPALAPVWVGGITLWYSGHSHP
ncbi:MAG: hypothetical protein V1717_00365 [Candidatus Micrarchaeota archaeon]